MIAIRKSFGPVLQFTLAGLFALLLLILSCSKSTDPDTNKPPDNGPIGVLLSGADSDPALTGTSDHGPFAVPEEEWNGDFVTTRLEAVINPSATVGQVNSALSAVGAKLSCMRPNMIFTELIISPIGDATDANVICSTLAASGAFSVAFPCFQPVEVNERPPQPAGLITGNLEMQGITAAWNARDHLHNNAQSVLVLVSDQFYARAPHTQIAALSFPTSAGSPSTAMTDSGFAIGNHGFMVAGTIGANIDALGATGVFPDQTHLLRIHGVPMGGFASWTALLYDLADAFPASGDFVLNSSYGYGGNFLVFPRERRILDALFWRSLVADKQSRFLHTQAAGNNGFFSPTLENADWNSPFSLASRFDTPTQMLQGNPTTDAWAAQIQSVFESLVTSRPAAATKLTNVLVVGSSNSSGELAEFSSGPSDLRMVSETHPVPCAVADNECSLDPSNLMMGWVDGTSFAAPQVAGLAAYLLALDNSLTIQEIKQILTANYNYKWVDAYKAVLSLDKSLATASIRVALLDISDAASSTGNPGPFNEEDLKSFLDSLKEYQTNRLSTTPPYSTDYSRCDLNGNGYTGDSALPNPYMPFDLDVNSPPTYSSVDYNPCPQVNSNSATLNESQMTDLAILKYYAYSPLYTGDTSIRDDLFGCGTGTAVIKYLSRRSYAYANAGKLMGSTTSCPPSTVADTSSKYTEGSFSFALGRNFICPDEQGEQLEATSTASGNADPGLVSGGASAIVNYSVALNASVKGKSGVSMSAVGGHFFELRFQIEGAAIPFVAECADAGTDANDKLHAALSKEGSGTVFAYNGGSGNPGQSFSGTLDPGIYTFLVNRDIHLTSSGLASAVVNGSVQLKIGQTATK